MDAIGATNAIGGIGGIGAIDGTAASDGISGDDATRAAADAARRRIGADPALLPRDRIGLSFSGGGIRSATFNLGVLQALDRHGFLPFVDYLSTVSGGSFIGGSLSHALRAPAASFPFPDPPTVSAPVEAPAVSYLRDNANYLAPRGVLDFARLAGVLLRGLLLNQLFVIVPLLGLAAALAAAVHGDELVAALAGQPVEHFRLLPWVAAVAVGWVLLFPIVLIIGRRLARARTGPRLGLRDLYERTFGALVIALLVAVFLDVQPALIAGFHAAIPGDHLTAGLSALVGALGVILASPVAQFLAGRLRLIGLAIAGVIGLALPLVTYLYLAHVIVYGGLPETEIDLTTVDVFARAAWSALIAAVVLLVAHGLLDVNTTGMHAFYRDRLTVAYQFRRRPDAAAASAQIDDARLFEPAPDLPLSQLSQPGTWAPYHLVNATVNLQGEGDPSLRGRGGDFFEFARHHIGGPRVGYATTEDYERAMPSLDLGTAVAISGAAVAPNMGSFTSAALAPLLGLLDIRLGLWVPNPARVRGQGRFRSGPLYLVREFLGRLDTRAPCVNVTDGGHLENLGVYGLLRRRCALIVACDAEADPGLTGQALATVIRFARLDLGVEIDIDLADIRLRPDRTSRRHVAVGRVHYPADPRHGWPASTGWLVYVKSSFVGDEPELVQDYRIASPAFPHESTADQFFGEAQFEAYRMLGDCIASGLFAAGGPRRVAGMKRSQVVGEFAHALAEEFAARAPLGDGIAALRRDSVRPDET
ncbi:MAG: patatin-like phospholipase family protein [Myxococcales bacterium]|nr:patatin-like phospholipase family protein [Myxococcales bacterium]